MFLPTKAKNSWVMIFKDESFGYKFRWEVFLMTRTHEVNLLIRHYAGTILRYQSWSVCQKKIFMKQIQAQWDVISYELWSCTITMFPRRLHHPDMKKTTQVHQEQMSCFGLHIDVHYTHWAFLNTKKSRLHPSVLNTSLPTQPCTSLQDKLFKWRQISKLEIIVQEKPVGEQDGRLHTPRLRVFIVTVRTWKKQSQFACPEYTVHVSSCVQ